ncbi:hypothetical protein E4T43_03583 [Aureobasidium subglaciale]|nr:hypothetical protein E4T43_03583 [Aureobasidium subglaciale]
MRSTTTTIAACAIALTSMFQYCPAPPLAAIIGVTTGELLTAGTSLAGTAITAGTRAGTGKRDIPPGVSQYSLQQCADSLAGVRVVFTPRGDGLLVSGMPAPCMNLATVITGDYNAGNPVPMSSDSILFSGLSNKQLQSIQNALDGK